MGRGRKGEGQRFAWCVTHGEQGGGRGREKQIMNLQSLKRREGQGVRCAACLTTFSTC